MLGGEDGLPHRYRLLVARQGARPQDQGGRHSRSRPGDVFVVESAGGGGYGPPAPALGERPRRRRRQRLRDAEARRARPEARGRPEHVPHRHRRRRHLHRSRGAWTTRGASTIAKSASTPRGSVRSASWTGLGRARRRARHRSRRRSSADTELIVHGTTVATNALLERKGAKVGMLTTEGHRDVIEMREGLKDDRYNLRMPPPVPLVPRGAPARRARAHALRRHGGDAARADARSTRAIAPARRSWASTRSPSATCTPTANAAPREGDAAGARACCLPGVYVSLSSDVLAADQGVRARLAPPWSTPTSARCSPRTWRACAGTPEGRRATRGDVLIMQSHGGVAPSPSRCRSPRAPCSRVPRAASPAAGTRRACSASGNLITFDMGGTSTDIALLAERRAAAHRRQARWAPAKVALPAHRHPHAGRGRRLDRPRGRGRDPPRRAGERGRRARGRPATAGAAPRRRSPTPTWSWASSIPATSSAGALALDAGAARARGRRRRARSSARAPSPPPKASQRVVNTNMAEGIRIVSVRRGVDPRRFALLAFGGAAGLHVTEVARLLEIRRVVVPARRRRALGVGHARHRPALRDRAHPRGRGRAQVDAGRPARAPRGAWRPKGAQRLGATSPGEIACAARSTCATASRSSRSACRSTGWTWTRRTLMDQVVERFHRRHEELYTYSAPGQEVVLVNARVAVIGELPELPRRAASGADARRRVTPDAPARLPRRVDGGARSTSWTACPRACEVKGPAIFESPTTTVLIRAERARDGDAARLARHRAGLTGSPPP